MKIAVLGLRGIPGIPGGVESHCERLYPRLVKLGCEVRVFSRSMYSSDKPFTYEGVNVTPLWTIKKKSLENLIHTGLATLIAKKYQPDIIHYHSIGAAFYVPLAKLLGFKNVVVTHHGFDYQRKKWGPFAQLFLKTGERNLIFADGVIAISKHIHDFLQTKFHKKSYLIYNGTELNPKTAVSCKELNRWKLEEKKYFLFAGRFVPEKCIHDLIHAFDSAKTNWKLVICGDSDHEDAYSKTLKLQGNKTKNVIFTGYLTGEPFNEIFSHAGCFVLPSEHEGFSISLLEAISFGLPCIVSDIPANHEIELPQLHYFPVHDTNRMKELLEEVSLNPHLYQNNPEFISEDLNWDEIANKTYSVYETLLESQKNDSKSKISCPNPSL